MVYDNPGDSGSSQHYSGCREVPMSLQQAAESYTQSFDWPVKPNYLLMIKVFLSHKYRGGKFSV